MPYEHIESKILFSQAGNDRGVTLLELVVYLVVAGLLLATAVTAFLGQNSSYNRQEVVTEIQQNIRGAIEVMSSDIRFAGAGLRETSEIAFASASSRSFSINLLSDLNEDWGDLNGDEKTVYYRIEPGTKNLQRAFGELLIKPLPLADWGTLDNWETLAENIEKLRFEYLIADTWVWKNDASTELDEIRAVKIVMLGGARDSAFNKTDPLVYRPPLSPTDPPMEPWDPAPGTGYKQLMSIVVQCRNNRG